MNTQSIRDYLQLLMEDKKKLQMTGLALIPISLSFALICAMISGGEYWTLPPFLDSIIGFLYHLGALGTFTGATMTILTGFMKDRPNNEG